MSESDSYTRILETEIVELRKAIAELKEYIRLLEIFINKKSQQGNRDGQNNRD